MVTPQMIILTIVFLGGNVLWFTFLFKRADPWLRKRIGVHYGVTIDIASKGLWKVRQEGQGARGCMIELLQGVFIIPASLLPILFFGILFMLLSPSGS
jgi:hypothetical protein